MSLRLNKLSMLLIAWLLTWLLLTVWGLERSQHNIPQVIPMPSFCDRQCELCNEGRDVITIFSNGPLVYRSHMRHNGMSQSDDGNGKSKKDWDRRFAHRLKIQMTNLEEEEKQDQIKDTQIKQALMKMMNNKKLKDNKLGERQQIKPCSEREYKTKAVPFLSSQQQTFAYRSRHGLQA